MLFKYEVEGGNFSKAGFASSEIKKILKQINIDAKIIKRIVVALYEGEVNVVAHATRGTVLADIDDKQIYIRIEDEGPGINDINLAMKEGYSTASEKVREMGFGAGMGLPNIKRNTDWLNLTSNVGEGTVLEMKTFF
ncbi:MAG: ATP-binding protein [Cytophagaceae bacterium]|jgi:anti-sigma regulatory factor (Ser/Thr protein kinase)|nr:ATP-binding protein [Cytophagaceae bacterium]